MKKSLLSMYAIIAAMIMLSLSACQKENTNSASEIGKATIIGVAWATFDPGATNLIQPVAVNTKIYAVISSKQLVTTTTSGSYANIIYETLTTDASGNFTFKVDANLNDVEVDFYSDDISVKLATDSKFHIWTIDPSSFSVSVTKGVVRYIDLEFTDQGVKY